MDDRSTITRLLVAHREGDREALNAVFEVVYRHLRRIAGGLLRGRGGTLGTTGLVNETYLKLVDAGRTGWTDRNHFFAVASKAMRQILVDHARAAGRIKRGGEVVKVALEDDPAGPGTRTFDLVAIDEALNRLHALDGRLARVVELRYFGGLTVEETAGVLEVDPRTVKRDWRKARALMHRDLRAEE